MFVFPAPYVAAAGVLTTLTQEDSATSTAETISTPAGVQSGDLLVLLDRAEGSASAPTAVVPSDFTSVSDLNAGSGTLSEFYRQIVSYKIADGTETTLTGMNGADSNRKALYLFRGDSAISAVAVQSLSEEVTNANPTSQSATASGGAVPLIVIGCYGSNGAVDPRTFSPAKDGEITPGTTTYLAYKIYNSSPADVSVDMDDEGSFNMLQSFYIECS